MDNTTINKIVKLPSEGQIYNRKIAPEITLRSMTTAEEMRRLSQTSYPYKLMSDLIASCIVDKVEMNPYDMCIGDYLFLMHKLRVVTYGPNYSISTICPYCMHENSDEIDLDDIPVKEYDASILDTFEFELPVTKHSIRIRFQTPRMMDMVAQRVDDFRKKSKNKDLDPTIKYTVSYLIESIDGKPVDEGAAEIFVQDLPMLDTQTILAHADKINKDIGLDLELEATCDVCKLKYLTTFRTTSEFFRPTINI